MRILWLLLAAALLLAVIIVMMIILGRLLKRMLVLAVLVVTALQLIVLTIIVVIQRATVSATGATSAASKEPARMITRSAPRLTVIRALAPAVLVLFTLTAANTTARTASTVLAVLLMVAVITGLRVIMTAARAASDATRVPARMITHSAQLLIVTQEPAQATCAQFTLITVGITALSVSTVLAVLLMAVVM
jgi:hypothetical protein